jgi:hypothetical protein
MPIVIDLHHSHLCGLNLLLQILKKCRHFIKITDQTLRFLLIRRHRQFYFGLSVQILEVQRKNLIIELKLILPNAPNPRQLRHPKQLSHDHYVLFLRTLDLLRFIKGSDLLLTLKFQKLLVNAPRQSRGSINFFLFALFNRKR